jgi:predicted ATP-binding protein involved in virulence
LSSTMVLSPTVAADGKEREMVCLPQEFIFGWLFTINPKNVKEEAREAVAKYRIECYRALYEHFSSAKKFLAYQREAINQLIDQRKEAKLNFNRAKSIFDAIERELDVTRHVTEEEWRENSNVLKLDFKDAELITEE